MAEQLPAAQTEHRLAEWIGVLVPPLAALSMQAMSYIMVTNRCATSASRVWLHVFPVAMLAVIGAVAARARSAWRSLGNVPPGDGGDPIARARLMAILGLLISGLSALVVIAQWAAIAILPPCSIP